MQQQNRFISKEVLRVHLIFNIVFRIIFIIQSVLP